MSGHTSHAPCDAYKLAVYYEWSRDVDDIVIVAPPDRSGHYWVPIDRWENWTLWRRVTLEPAS